MNDIKVNKPIIFSETINKLENHVGFTFDIDKHNNKLDKKYKLLTNLTGSKWHPGYNFRPRFENTFLGRYITMNYNIETTKDLFINTNSFIMSSKRELVELNENYFPEKSKDYLIDFFKKCNYAYENEVNLEKRKEIQNSIEFIVKNEIINFKNKNNSYLISKDLKGLNILDDQVYFFENLNNKNIIKKN